MWLVPFQRLFFFFFFTSPCQVHSGRVVAGTHAHNTYMPHVHMHLPTRRLEPPYKQPIYIHTHIYMHTHMCTHGHVPLYMQPPSTHPCTHMCLHAHPCTRTCHTRTHTGMYPHRCRPYTHMHAHTHAYMPTHAHTPTHTCAHTGVYPYISSPHAPTHVHVPSYMQLIHTCMHTHTFTRTYPHASTRVCAPSYVHLFHTQIRVCQGHHGWDHKRCGSVAAAPHSCPEGTSNGRTDSSGHWSGDPRLVPWGGSLPIPNKETSVGGWLRAG